MNAELLNLAPGEIESLLGAVELAGALDQRSLLRAGLAAADALNGERLQVLSRLQSTRAAREHDVILTSRALLGLMRMAAADDNRVMRRTLTADGPQQSGRVSAEDLQCLKELGYMVERSGGKWLEITDTGNALVREMLEFARQWNGGGL